MKHKYWGKMVDGAALFIDDDGGLLLENGPGPLTGLTPERRAAAFERWPGLLSLCRSRSTLLPRANKVDAVAYKVMIADQAAWIDTNRGTIAALKAALAERGAIVNDLLSQISELNDRILTLHATNRRWEGVVARWEEGIVSLVDPTKRKTTMGLYPCNKVREAAAEDS